MVQVHCTEGVASHSGPESCAGTREGAGEALTGDRIGQPLSRESGAVLSADTLQFVEGNIASPLMRGHGGLGAVEDPGMCGRSLRGNREILGLAGSAPPVRAGKARGRSR
jgi:hypothetical protein